MSKLPFIDVDEVSCLDQQQKTESYLKGEIPLPEFLSGFTSWPDFFASLKTATSEADLASVEKSNTPRLLRIKALFAIAGNRDAAYVLAGRSYVMKVGYNSRLRLPFEVFQNTVRNTS